MVKNIKKIKITKHRQFYLTTSLHRLNFRFSTIKKMKKKSLGFTRKVCKWFPTADDLWNSILNHVTIDINFLSNSPLFCFLFFLFTPHTLSYYYFFILSFINIKFFSFSLFPIHYRIATSHYIVRTVSQS